MRVIGVKELKATLSEALREAENGQRITVTKHGRPVAELGPPSAGETAGQQMRRLVAEGVVTPAVRPMPQEAPPLYEAERSVSDLILAERELER